ncbi:hypothetical protein [Aeromonas hydrophila]|uniref:hypothetical protein n=1 Tax=Aeromonas hydrophila TaxID=644 RepID=UPI00209FDED5|nr:hypothetical protein [Aeromonas hydrophila]MCP1268864.1 hypothetical protein [Aeromonas hydrophila]MCP1297415.1 hypothetical protein [Aeromonas hydrophila]
MTNIGNIILSAILAAFFWYPVAALIYAMDKRESEAMIAASLISAAIFFLVAMKLGNKQVFTLIASKVASSIHDAKEKVEFNREVKDANFYAQAEDEYDSGDIDRGLWSQALVNANGDESLRKVEYMKLRAKQLKRESSKSGERGG